MPSDAQRIQKVKLLADNGYADRVVVAHDMHLKHRLVSTITYRNYNRVLINSMSCELNY